MDEKELRSSETVKNVKIHEDPPDSDVPPWKRTNAAGKQDD